MIATPAPICDVSRTLADMRAAIGRQQWSSFAQATATGSATISGLKGTARFNLDFRSGRYAQYFDVAVMGRSAEVYDGTNVWAKDISGGVHPYDAWFPRERARTDAFILSGAYLDPKSGAKYSCAGTRREGGRDVLVIRIQPRGGGIPAQLAVDSQTHLLASVTERFPITTRVTRYADYRTVDGVVLPFSISQGTELEPDDGFTLNVQRYDVAKRVVPADFSRPMADENVTMTGGVTSTTIPLKLEHRQLLVWASINGHAPMPFILDTGGHAILTTGAAKTLGLHASGAGESGGAGAGTIGLQYARVQTIRLGAAELRNQPMLVINYPYDFYERGQKQPIAGILGLEVFEHFATRIDYGDGKITLAPLSSYSYQGNGTPIPFHFQDDMPMIDAAADNHAGMFGTDTGNAGTLILFGDYLQRTGLQEAYRGGTLVIGHGTGGRNTGRREVLHTYTIGGHTIRNVPSNFTNMSRGAFSSWTEAGNAGYEIFARFIPTFDYAHQTIYLDRCIRDCQPAQNRTGLAYDKEDPTYFSVLAVAAGSAAERAGIAPGDHIVAVDGTSATDLSSADLWTLVSQPRAASLHLMVQHGSANVERVITLND